MNADGSQQSTRAGPLYGLRLLVRTNQDDYVSFVRTAGVRVAVHLRGTDPFIEAFGYDAPPGMVSALGVSYGQFVRLGSPYDTCIEKAESTKTSSFDGGYTPEACFRTCLNSLVGK